MAYVTSEVDDTDQARRTGHIANKSGNTAIPRTAAIVVIAAIIILGIEAGALRRFL